MKLIDITTFYSTGRGGITTYLEQKAELSAKEPNLTHQLILAGRRDEVSNFHGSLCHWVKSRASAINPHYRFLLNYFKIKKILAAENPDVIETSDPYWLPLYLLRIRRALRFQGKLMQTKLFLFYRVDFPDTYVVPILERFSKLLADWAHQLSWVYLRAVLNRMDAVLVHSEVMRDKLAQHGITAPMHVVGNLTNCDTYQNAKLSTDFHKTLRSRFGETTARILFCGRLSPEKGIDNLLTAFNTLRLSPLRPVLVVIGDGPLRDQVSSLASDAKNRLHYVSATPDRSYLASLFASCDMMVMPGPHETFSMVTLEAIHVGLPVVGIRGSGGISALIQPGIGFLCKRADSAELAEKIQLALKPKTEWYRDEVRHELMEHYKPTRVYANLLRVYGVGEAAQKLKEVS